MIEKSILQIDFLIIVIEILFIRIEIAISTDRKIIFGPKLYFLRSSFFLN